MLTEKDGGGGGDAGYDPKTPHDARSCIDFAFNDGKSARTGYSAFTTASKANKKKKRMPKLSDMGFQNRDAVTEIESQYESQYREGLNERKM